MALTIGTKSSFATRPGLFLAGALFTAQPAVAQQADPADRIFFNGPIITVDAKSHVAEALAIDDGRIVAVGDKESVLRRAGPKTVLTDLAGRAVIPGFIDAHSHLLSTGAVSLYQVDLNSPPIGKIRSIDDIVRVLAERAKTVPAGGTIVGFGYDDTLLAEHRHPNRHDLDRASTRHRIIITHVSVHFAAANSYALEQSGITKDTPDPAGGVIRREADGKPSGVLEESAKSLVKRGPDAVYSEKQWVAAAAHAAKMYAAAGVTTAQNGVTGAAAFRRLSLAKKRGLIPIRLVALPSVTLARKLGTPPVRGAIPAVDEVGIGAVKLFADGSIQGYTGYLTQPYFIGPSGDKNYRGHPTKPCGQLTTPIKGLVKKGWQIAVHANGDAAIDCVLSAFEAAKAANGGKIFRPIIIHAQMTRPDQLDKMSELGAIPSFFSLHTYYWGDRHRDIFLGSERAARISPTRTALDKGVVFTVHTDTPVVPISRTRLLWATVNRLTTSGAVLGPDERITTMDALRAMTINAAYQYGFERELGSLETGKIADLVILSRDLLTMDPAKLDKLQIMETIVGGKSVYTK
jgi:predicted amidohydrolase YtcJ